MRKENEIKIDKDLNILSLGNVNFTENASEGKKEKKNNPQLRKKRKRNNSIKKSTDDLEFLYETQFTNIKSNSSKQNEQNMNPDNNKSLIINEEENSTNFSVYNNNNNDAKKNNKKIQIEEYECAFDFNGENEIQENNNNYFNYLSLWNNIMNIQDLSNEIENLMKELKIDKKSIETYNKLHSDILTNKIAINRLNIMINILSNSNIINLKRTIIEVLIFELFKNNQEYFELLNYKPSKPNIEELKNLIHIKLEENNEKCKEEIERLNELINNNYNNTNGESYIKIIEKKNKKRAQINMIFQFLKFCKKDLNPFVHATGQKINYYLLPKNCLNTNLDEVKYLFALEDILSEEIDSNDNKNQNLNKANNPSELDIYAQKKVLSIDEALNLLLSKNKIFNFLNDNFSNEIKKKQIVLSQKLKDFDKKLDIFSGIFLIQKSTSVKIPILKNDLLNENRNFIKQLDLFDSFITDIFCNEFNEEIESNIELMKQCIKSDICSRCDIVEKIEKLNPEKANDFICLKLFRLSKILIFLKKQKEKIIHIYESLYEENEKFYNEIIDKVQTLKNIVNKKYTIKNELLFDKWIKSGPKINNKFCKIEILRQNFIDLIKTIELDVNYSYDEKFTLWLVKNNFDNYLLN